VSSVTFDVLSNRPIDLCQKYSFQCIQEHIIALSICHQCTVITCILRLRKKAMNLTLSLHGKTFGGLIQIWLYSSMEHPHPLIHSSTNPINSWWVNKFCTTFYFYIFHFILYWIIMDAKQMLKKVTTKVQSTLNGYLKYWSRKCFFRKDLKKLGQSDFKDSYQGCKAQIWIRTKCTTPFHWVQLWLFKFHEQTV